MSTSTMELASYCQQVAERAAHASQQLSLASGAAKNDWLQASARALRAETDLILAANQQDLDRADEFGLTSAQVDRLRLTADRVSSIAGALEEIAMLPNPVGEIIESSIRPNGLEVSKVRVPLGVIFFVYESRPNVTADAAAICVKSGNAVILRGGKEAAGSSQAIVSVLQQQLVKFGLPEDAVQLVETTDRTAVGEFLKLAQFIDVAIPRGGRGLIERVAAEATMPVIKHFDGNCHIYVDEEADLEMALEIVVNSKCQRTGVCNACESLLVHRSVATEFLPRLAERFREEQVEVRGDTEVCHLMPTAKTASEEDYRTEYLDRVISARVVESLAEAVEHINRDGSHHTDAIVTSSLAHARQFAAAVDSAAVMINASTRFNDGGEFGLGAEIGISTDKHHARGPCGLRELTSYKYIVYGNGQVRS